MKDVDCVIDAYCGIGILCCILANQKNLIIGIDAVPENIEDAKFNAQQNSVQSHTKYNASFTIYCIFNFSYA
jgi:23S rRNA (uracil1939-C5)-methyltransferase